MRLKIAVSAVRSRPWPPPDPARDPHPTHPPGVRVAAASLLLFTALGCGESNSGSRVTAVTVSLPDVLVAGSREQAAVSIGTTVATAPTPTVTWETSDPAVVRIDASGRADAVGPGAAFVTARANGVSGTTRVSVVPAAAGTWSGSVVRETCLEPAGCYLAPSPREVIDGRLTLTQTADRVAGGFVTVSGVPVALSGRVDTAGVITLSGEGRMFLDDGRLWVYIGVRSWTTTLRDGRLSGNAVTAKQELGKGGETLGALVTARGPVDLR
jgi:hypothetical protein